jgi:hypothetical protein
MRSYLKRRHARFRERSNFRRWPPSPLQGKSLSWLKATLKRVFPRRPDWLAEDAVPEEDARSAMTTANERRYVEWFAANLYRGKGAIVELGCWLGSLTRALCRGLRANRRLARRLNADGSSCPKVDVFDYFQWDSVMESWVAGTPIAGRIPIGGDYEALYREQIVDDLPMIAIHHADLATEPWSSGPIEFLLVDAMKTMPTARGICRNFYPALLPRDGYLAHQDFLHFFHSWIHVTTYLLRDCFEWVFQVPDSDMVVFRCVRPVPRRAFPETLSGFSSAEIAAAFDWAEEHVRGPKSDTIAAARAMAHFHRGETAAGKRLVTEALSGAYANSAAFRQLRQFTRHFGLVDWKENE